MLFISLHDSVPMIQIDKKDLVVEAGFIYPDIHSMEAKEEFKSQYSKVKDKNVDIKLYNDGVLTNTLNNYYITKCVHCAWGNLIRTLIDKKLIIASGVYYEN